MLLLVFAVVVLMVDLYSRTAGLCLVRFQAHACGIGFVHQGMNPGGFRFKWGEDDELGARLSSYTFPFIFAFRTY